MGRKFKPDKAWVVVKSRLTEGFAIAQGPEERSVRDRDASPVRERQKPGILQFSSVIGD